MAFDFGEVLGKVVEGLMKTTEAVQVIGEPVQAGNKLIIPAVVARIGFGAGGGKSGSIVTSEDDVDEVVDGDTGGGGGGGLALTPVFLIVDEDGERLLTVPGPLQSACTVVDRMKSTLDSILPCKSDDEPAPDDDE